jgi:hypothetical protein
MADARPVVALPLGFQVVRGRRRREDLGDPVRHRRDDPAGVRLREGEVLVATPADGVGPAGETPDLYYDGLVVAGEGGATVFRCEAARLSAERALAAEDGP